jgi:hypothetical protein
LFDAHGVSFVSVTQQFNTTTSMGRLTLNVLLSFAQFEREVTSERIRDKIGASKRRGLWVGGMVPLGYVSRDKKFFIEEEEAERVRTIFRFIGLDGLAITSCHAYVGAMTMPIDQNDYSVVVKHRAPPPKSWRWEIYRAGRRSPIEQSSVYFHTMAAANRAGREALKQLLDKLHAEHLRWPAA